MAPRPSPRGICRLAPRVIRKTPITTSARRKVALGSVADRSFPFSVCRNWNALCLFWLTHYASGIAAPDALPVDVEARAKRRERQRANSKLLLGNKDRLEVAVAIARSKDGVVNATDLQFELNMLNSRVRAQLVAFAEVGLLEPDSGSAGKRWYVRQDSSFWATCIELHEKWARE